MRHGLWRGTLGMLALAGLLMLGGCGSTESEPAPSAAGEHLKPGDHSGWWCVEHAIPESECSMCSRSAAEEFKANGDWCDEHHRAASQCFICDPDQAERYARLYFAKFGEEPPAPIE